MRLFPDADDLECIVADDHPTPDIPMTLDLLRMGIDGELDGGPGGGAPVHAWLTQWREGAVLMEAVHVDN
mgnify:CR=1 FL=1